MSKLVTTLKQNRIVLIIAAAALAAGLYFGVPLLFPNSSQAQAEEVQQPSGTAMIVSEHAGVRQCDIYASKEASTSEEIKALVQRTGCKLKVYWSNITSDDEKAEAATATPEETTVTESKQDNAAVAVH